MGASNSLKERMAFTVEAISFSALFLLLSSSFHFPSMAATTNPTEDPTPTAWPLQFHSILFMNNTAGKLQKVDLWYDWPNGRNFNIIQNQLGELLYDLEWDNGTSYIYTLDPANEKCRVLHFPVGILRPNWLEGATYLGQHYVDNFLCNLWQKVDFIWYYEDVLTRRPVKWIFYTGMIAHVMTFEVGAVLEDEKWQAPLYCFTEAAEGSDGHLLEASEHGASLGKLTRATSNNAVDAM